MCPPSPDHPRSRGVYPDQDHSIPLIDGSSPLARGLRRALSRRSSLLRIIPARAGFTHGRPGPVCADQDHPRSRGVYRIEMTNWPTAPGSSPLARGLHAVALSLFDEGGIIPARAGFTLADPWNPNDEPCYQTAFTFSADLEPAPPSSGSAVVLRRSTMTPSEA